jgi:ABC-type Mn2+/Zn2+ transport system ATPase subunit
MAAPVSATAPPLLACEKLGVGRRQRLLVDIDLAIAGGEAWFVLGENGAGKSTLLLTMLGLLPPLAGRVLWHPSLLDRGRLGYVPQEQRFDPPLPMTGAEFVASALPDDVPWREVAARCEQAMLTMGVAELR